MWWELWWIGGKIRSRDCDWLCQPASCRTWRRFALSLRPSAAWKYPCWSRADSEQVPCLVHSCDQNFKPLPLGQARVGQFVCMLWVRSFICTWWWLWLQLLLFIHCLIPVSKARLSSTNTLFCTVLREDCECKANTACSIWNCCTLPIAFHNLVTPFNWWRLFFLTEYLGSME